MLIMDSTPKTCNGCPFVMNSYGDPPDCRLFSLVGLKIDQFTTPEPIEKHIKNNTKCPYCPLKPVPEPFSK